MSHFTKIAESFDVSGLLDQIEAQPELWNQHTYRTKSPGSPHSEVDDIWLRYCDYELRNDRAAFYEPHVPVWYPAYHKLPALRSIIFGLMGAVQGEMLGGCFITRIPPHATVSPHADRGWNAEYFDKFYIALMSPWLSHFAAKDGDEYDEISPTVGDVHLFDNTKTHWVHNDSNLPKMTLILSIRTALFGRA